VITPGEKVNFTIPTLEIVTGLDPVPGKWNQLMRNMCSLVPSTKLIEGWANSEWNILYIRPLRNSLRSRRARGPTFFWCHDWTYVVRQRNCLRSRWFDGSSLRWIKRGN
jgi:hypothetical protein